MEAFLMGNKGGRWDILFFSAAVTVVILLSVFGNAASFMGNDIGQPASTPGPVLLYPVTDRVDLTGKESVVFKWEKIDAIRIREYDFRLYKGYATTAGSLMIKKKVPVDEYPIAIASKEFDLNQVYTWVLTEIFDNGIKSDKSFSSFKIIKK
jgi:hypothetical protein